MNEPCLELTELRAELAVAVEAARTANLARGNVVEQNARLRAEWETQRMHLAERERVNDELRVDLAAAEAVCEALVGKGTPEGSAGGLRDVVARRMAEGEWFIWAGDIKAAADALEAWGARKAGRPAEAPAAYPEGFGAPDPCENMPSLDGAGVDEAPAPIVPHLCSTCADRETDIDDAPCCDCTVRESDLWTPDGEPHAPAPDALDALLDAALSVCAPGSKATGIPIVVRNAAVLVDYENYGCTPRVLRAIADFLAAHLAGKAKAAEGPKLVSLDHVKWPEPEASAPKCADCGGGSPTLSLWQRLPDGPWLCVPCARKRQEAARVAAALRERLVDCGPGIPLRHRKGGIAELVEIGETAVMVHKVGVGEPIEWSIADVTILVPEKPKEGNNAK